MPIYSNEDMCRVIESYVHNLRYRQILRLRYCDGYTHEEIAETVGYSTQHVKAICREYKTLLLSRL